MSSVQRSIKRNYNKNNGKGCPKCGNVLMDGICAICGWVPKNHKEPVKIKND